MIDVLRASTTITTALAHGAAGVWPVADVDEARRLTRELAGRPLLGGERGGVPLAGFDLGNSPADYTPHRVADRPVVVTTTNGTAALAACAAAAEILVGALVNRRAVAAVARSLGRQAGILPVHLVCAGTEGEVSAEDVLAAGAILDAAADDPAAAHDTLDPAAAAAREAFRRLVRAPDVGAALVAAFRASPGGAALVGLGMDADLEVCARLDVLPVVGRLDRDTGCLHAMRS